jgi:hypothetical protein
MLSTIAPGHSSRAIPTPLRGYRNPVHFVTSRIPHGDIVAFADKLRVLDGRAICDEPGVLSCCLHTGAFQSEDVTGSQVSDEVEIECSHAASGFDGGAWCNELIKAQRSSDAVVESAGGNGHSRPPSRLLRVYRYPFTFCCAVGDFGSVTVRTPLLNEAAILS